MRHSCLLSNRKAAAAYLGVCVRTIRHWDAGRCRVPWSAVRLLRLLRAGELGGLLDGWDGWTIFRDRLVSPDGRAYRERDMRQLWLTLTQARLFREGYERSTAPAPGAAASEWNERPPVAADVGDIRGAGRQGAAPSIAPAPLPCQTALPCPPVARGNAGESPPPGKPSGAAGGRACAPSITAITGAVAGGHDANMASQCRHEAASAGSIVGACNMEQTAAVSHSTLPFHERGGLPLANRGGTYLNEIQTDVSLASPCKGVA